MQAETGVQSGGGELDGVVHYEGVTFILNVKQADDIALIDSARRQLASDLQRRPDAVGVLAVPYMGPKARGYARSERLSWLDLSGNADIRAPGVRILVEGKANRFASPGRPSTAFSDKAARISRSMLIDAERWWRQAELQKATGLSSGYVSKVVGRLDEDGLLDRRRQGGTFRPRSPDLLLDAWAQVYDFRKHELTRYHAVGRTGPSVTKAVASGLAKRPDLRWAATGLSAAWLRTRHADHRLVTFYVSGPWPSPDELGLRPVERGENVWIVFPRDEGIFHGTEGVEGVECVSAVQVYLDLLGHPERSSEAAAVLRTHQLGRGDT